MSSHESSIEDFFKFFPCGYLLRFDFRLEETKTHPSSSLLDPSRLLQETLTPTQCLC